MNPIRKICIFGMGGVGGYFGGKIATVLNKIKEDTSEIYFIARGEHLDTIRKNGITLVSPDQSFNAHPTVATQDMKEIPDPDLVLLCVKSYGLADALKAIQPKVNSHTLIIPLLNGVDIYERIRSQLDEGIILPACVYVSVFIEKPGFIRQSGGDGKILYGKDPHRDDFSSTRIESFFEKVGIHSNYTDDPFPAIWEKYLFIAAFGLVTAYADKTVGEILKDRQSVQQLEAIIKEIASIADRKKISLPPDIISRTIAKGHQFPFDTKTSYQRDVEQKKPYNEGDLFGGTIIRQGKSLGIPTPVTAAIYSQIQRR